MLIPEVDVLLVVPLLGPFQRSHRDTNSLIFIPSAGIPTKAAFATMFALTALAQQGEIPADLSVPAQQIVAIMIEQEKQQAELIYPDLAIHVSEAWMLQLEMKNYTEEQKKASIELAQREGIANHPDRTEVVIVGWKSKTGEEGHHIRHLKRDEDGKASLGDYLINDQLGLVTSNYLAGIFKGAKAGVAVH